MDKAQRAEQLLRNVVANMRIEGFELSEETKANCMAVISGEKSADELVSDILQRYLDKSVSSR